MCKKSFQVRVPTNDMFSLDLSKNNVLELFLWSQEIPQSSRLYTACMRKLWTLSQWRIAFSKFVDLESVLVVPYHFTNMKHDTLAGHFCIGESLRNHALSLPLFFSLLSVTHKRLSNYSASTRATGPRVQSISETKDNDMIQGNLLATFGLMLLWAIALRVV